MPRFSSVPFLLGACATAAFSCFSPLTPSATAQPQPRPRLVVTIVVDQLRGDYLDRFSDLFLPPGNGKTAGGFRFLRERGANYAAARHQHFPLYTGPGHSIVLTGGFPYKTGIIGNEWYDKGTQSVVYCVQDPEAKVVGAVAGSRAKPMSPKNFRSTTVGDELKMATGGEAKVATVSLKDRAAILLGGRLSDASIWFDDSTGRWISSSAYCADGKLPTWVETYNARKVPDANFGQQWKPSFPLSAMERVWRPSNFTPPVYPEAHKGAFPYTITGGLTAPGRDYYRAWVLTPWANAYTLDTAKAEVRALGMGQDEIPDLLGINLSSNDYVGHAYGPNSPEVLDMTVQTDRQLADFFRFLDGAVPGGLKNVTIALTADHGVDADPESLQAAGMPGGRMLDSQIEAAADKALDARYGEQDWVMAYVEPYVYLRDSAIQAAKITPEEANRVAADGIKALNGIYNAYPREQVEGGQLGTTDMASRLYKGFYPKIAGDVMVVNEQGWMSEEKQYAHRATHGSPYAYDSEVPLLLEGYGIRPGTYYDVASPSDLAPSLSALLGISLPSACDGQALKSALK